MVRDCYSWVESIVNHMLTREIPADVREFMDWWFEPQKYPHKDEEQSLDENGLFSLDCYLNCWKGHVYKATELIPPPRLLVIRTHEITRKLDDIAQFLHVPRQRLDGANSHLNRGTRAKQLPALVDKTFLEDAVTRVCGNMMGQYFPEVRSIDQAYGLWS